MNKNEKSIFDALRERGFTVQGACAVLANMHAESACRPDNLQNSGNARLKMTDAEYTGAVDNGTYTKFATDSHGYGLCQWTYHSRKAALLKLAQSRGVSIADIGMQVDFMVEEMSTSKLLPKIKNAVDVAEATRRMMLDYERPANKTEANIETRIRYARIYYAEFAPADLAADLATLTDKGIITSHAYWEKTALSVKYLPELIHNMAEAIR